MLTFAVWHLTPIIQSEYGQEGAAYLQCDKWEWGCDTVINVHMIYSTGHSHPQRMYTGRDVHTKCIISQLGWGGWNPAACRRYVRLLRECSGQGWKVKYPWMPKQSAFLERGNCGKKLNKKCIGCFMMRRWKKNVLLIWKQSLGAVKCTVARCQLPLAPSFASLSVYCTVFWSCWAFPHLRLVVADRFAPLWEFCSQANKLAM